MEAVERTGVAHQMRALSLEHLPHHAVATLRMRMAARIGHALLEQPGIQFGKAVEVQAWLEEPLADAPTGAGLSGSGIAVATSTSRTAGRGASPLPGIGKSSVSWNGGRIVVMRRPSYLPSPSTPHRGPFGPSAAEAAYYALC